MSWQEDTNQADEELVAKNRASKAVDQGVAELGAWANPPSQDELDAIGRGVKGNEDWTNGGTGAIELSPWSHLPPILDYANNYARGQSKYTPERFWRILEQLKKGVPLTVAANANGVTDSAVTDWCAKDDELKRQVAGARLLGMDQIAADALAIVDGLEAVPDCDVNSRRIRADIRLKLLKVWDRQRYGDNVTIRGDSDAPLAVTRYDLTDEQLLAIAAKGGA